MAVTETDVELYAARIRAHFPSELKETAFQLAYSIARIVGPQAKQLRPETTFDEVIEWLGPHYGRGKNSLDRVEIVMAMEEELGDAFVLPDELAARSDSLTFAELVRHVAQRKDR
jgi:hypothetical protein